MNDDRRVSFVLELACMSGGSEKGGKLNPVILIRHFQFEESFILRWKYVKFRRRGSAVIVAFRALCLAIRWNNWNLSPF